MAFDDDEFSASSSAPVWLYEFITPSATYRLTNQMTDYVFGLDTYVATPIKHSEVVGASLEDVDEIVVTLPASHALVTENVFTILPGTFTFTLRRAQRVSGAAITIVEGQVVAINVNVDGEAAEEAEIRIPSLMNDALATPVPSAVYQPQCNHDLYGPECGEDPGDWTEATTVTAINGAVVTVASVGGVVDAWFDTGRITRILDGETRMIETHVGNDLTLIAPFRALEVGDAVTLLRGCLHDVKTCFDIFNNVANFGGHPYITANPFSFAEFIRLLRDT